MRILIAPDSFKGSASSRELCEMIERALLRRAPHAEIIRLPMADGGEGTVEALVLINKGRFCTRTVSGPLLEPREAVFGVLGDGKTAVIEMAAALGLPFVPREKRDPFRTTSAGTGQLIAAALYEGGDHVIMGIGGNATNDGGAGMLHALGFGLLYRAGQPIAPGASGVSELARIETTAADPRLRTCRFTVACDVDSPLCGPRGASAVFGPQKGARPQDVPVLDAVLARFGSLLEQTAGRNVVNVPGAGAAGGMGAALMALLGAELRPGFAIVNEVTGYERLLQTGGIDLVITGEGQMNAQSLMGKLPVEAARLAKKYGVRCVAIVGSRGEGAEHAEQCGFSSVYELMTEGMTLEYSMTHTAELVEQAVKQIDLTGGQV